MHPLGALVTGAIAAVIFVYGFQFEQEKLKIDDVLGVWPLHGVIGTWGRDCRRYLWPENIWRDG
jgi:ammonium transporter